MSSSTQMALGLRATIYGERKRHFDFQCETRASHLKCGLKKMCTLDSFELIAIDVLMLIVLRITFIVKVIGKEVFSYIILF